jgi:hypothetical protein
MARAGLLFAGHRQGGDEVSNPVFYRAVNTCVPEALCQKFGWKHSGQELGRLTYLPTEFARALSPAEDVMSVQLAARCFAWVLAAFLFSFLGSSLLTVISSKALSSARFDAAVKTALSSHQLEYDKTPSDQFTECALLTTVYLRPKSLAENAFNTHFAHDYKFHPCQVLSHIVTGEPPGVALDSLGTRGYHSNYVSYPFGTRHLAALALSLMELSTYRLVLGMLAILSMLSLTISAAYVDIRKAWVYVAPLTITMFIGFSLHTMLTNFGHGPDCWVAFLMLAGFLAFSTFFQPLYRRVAFAVSLSVVVTFLDMFDGAAPIAVMLLIFFNQVFYGHGSLRSAVGQAALLSFAALGGAVVYTVLRLSILAGAFGIEWRWFLLGIQARAGMDIGDAVITLPQLFIQLWDNRSFMVWGNQTASTVLLLSSGLAWCFAIATLVSRWRYLDQALRANFLIAALSSIGTACWFILFPNHTYIHAPFMVRVLVVPVGLGFAVLLSVLPAWRARELVARAS